LNHAPTRGQRSRRAANPVREESRRAPAPSRNNRPLTIARGFTRPSVMVCVSFKSAPEKSTSSLSRRCRTASCSRPGRRTRRPWAMGSRTTPITPSRVRYRSLGCLCPAVTAVDAEIEAAPLRRQWSRKRRRLYGQISRERRSRKHQCSANQTEYFFHSPLLRGMKQTAQLAAASRPHNTAIT